MSKVCSSHNLSVLDTILCDLGKYLYGLRVLADIPDDEKIAHLSDWSGLHHDLLCLAEQAHTDLLIFDRCLRDERDMDD